MPIKLLLLAGKHLCIRNQKILFSGRVVQEGIHKELIAEEGLYKQLVQRQMLGYYFLSFIKKNFF
jgi:hypothetical protein